MIAEIPPGLILILGAVLVPLLKGWARNIYMVALPIVLFPPTQFCSLVRR